MVTRLTLFAALLGLSSACYKLPSDGCPQTPCVAGLVCMQGLCVTPAAPLADAGQTPLDAATPPQDAGHQTPLDAATPPQDAGSADNGVAVDAGPDLVCGNGILEAGEDCDDGDTVNAGCIDCIREPFGSGFVLGPDFACSLVAHDGSDEDRPGNGVACWGNNQFAQLGANPAVTRRVLPVLHPSRKLYDLVQLAAGEKNVCALTKSNRIWCWGSSNNLLLGDHNPPLPDYNADPIEIDLRGDHGGVYPPVHQIAMGWDHACAIFGDARKVVCWGNIESGQLGIGFEDGVTSRFDLARAVQGPDGNSDLTQVRFLALGHRFSMAVGRVDDGDSEAFKLFGWGSLPQDEMLINHVWTEQPSGIATELGDEFQSEPELSVGKRHFCTRIGNSTHCAGNNESHATGASQAGRGRGLEEITVSGGRQIRQVWAFASGSCALLEKQDDPSYRRLGCWGDDTYSQMLDDQPGGNSSTLKTLPSFGDSAVRLLAHGPFAQWRCAQLDDEYNSIYCWGRNDKGQTGQPYAGAISSTPSPVFLDASDQPSGDGQANPLMNCEAARDLGLASGVYWVKHGDQATYQAYCDTNEANDGGGWSLAMHVPGSTSDLDRELGGFDAPVWTTATSSPLPQNLDTVTGADAYQAMLSQPVSALRLQMLPTALAGGMAAQNPPALADNLPEGSVFWRSITFTDLLFEGRSLRAQLRVVASLSFGVPSQDDPITSANWANLVPDIPNCVDDVGCDYSRPLQSFRDNVNNNLSWANCWWSGSNIQMPHAVHKVRIGAVVAVVGDNGMCTTGRANNVSFGSAPGSEGFYPSVGAYAADSNGSLRYILVAKGRIWVR